MKVIIFLLTILGSIAIYFSYSSINYTVFKENINFFITSTSILFAILGVWIALLYPKEFKDLKENTEEATSDRHKDLKSLIWSMVLCVLTICSILLVNFSSLYLKKYINLDNIIVFQLIASFYLLIITIIQIYCYLIILLPTTFIENQINIHKQKKDIMDKFSPDED